MSIIKLTLKTGGEMYVNSQYISFMKRETNVPHPNDNEKGGVTLLSIGNDESVWRILETPEQILEMAQRSRTEYCIEESIAQQNAKDYAEIMKRMQI